MASVTLNSVAARQKLKPRHEPYYLALMQGCSLGFRKMSSDSEGTWSARYIDNETGKASKKSFGPFDDRAPSQRFGAAKEAAEAWFKHLGAGGTVEVVTVKGACENYVQHVRSHKGKAKGDEIDARFRRWVYEDRALARVELPKLTRASLDAWRKRLMDTPVVENPHAENKTTHVRSPATLNRDMAALRAALNHAHDHGYVASDLAWRVSLKAATGAGANGRRDLYLDRDERRALLAHADAEVSRFLRGLTLLPLRPGALADLKVSNFNEKLGVLTVGKDKAGDDRRMPLPAALVTFFTEASTDKLPTAPLLGRANGKHWKKDDWKGPIKDAALAAKLPRDTTAYTVRHSVITDLVLSNLDLLTVAQLSGTSVEMIERHYGHLQASRAVQALEGLAL